MGEVSGGITEIKIDSLVPFRICSSQMYENARLEQLINSIKRVGLMSPIIVRPIDDGKYEIICGHNRTKAMKALGHDVIHADVRYGLSDDEALELFYDSNLNQKSFSDWDYSHRFEAIKYSEKVMGENSQQGRRTDLEKKQVLDADDQTCVQTRQKLKKDSKQRTTRGKMANRLGISTATLSKYRRIIKLPDDQLNSIAQFLDEKRITFEAAYIISGMRYMDRKFLLEGINKFPERKLDLKILKELVTHNTAKNSGTMPRVSREEVLKALPSLESSGAVNSVIHDSIARYAHCPQCKGKHL